MEEGELSITIRSFIRKENEMSLAEFPVAEPARRGDPARCYSLVRCAPVYVVVILFVYKGRE